METGSYNLNQLVEEVTKHYPSNGDQVLSVLFIDNHAKEQSFINLDSDGTFNAMLVMYEKEKEITIYVTTSMNYLNTISKKLGEYEVCRSSDNRAEVKFKGKRWEVLLDERKCNCRIWQVKGLPCVHATTFIAFTRDADWCKYVDSYFTVDKFKEAYALEIVPMQGKDEWLHIETSDKIYPPIIKRPPG